MHVEGIVFWGLAFPGRRTPWADDGTDEWWRDRLDAALAAAALSVDAVGGCLVLDYGHAEDPCVAVALEPSIVRGEWGAPARFGGFDVDPAWTDRLRLFCDLLGIEWSAPGWWAAASVG